MSTVPPPYPFTALTRRRAIVLFAAAAGGAALPGPTSAASRTRWRTHWRGTAMGGDASIILDGFADAQADELVQAATRELSRLEGIFSLHIPTSDIVRLNRTGSLSPAPEELLEALALATDLNQKSNGAFDPTVQALWNVHAQSLDAGETSPTKASLLAAQARVGFHHVRISERHIQLHAEAALTLNGIAQGIMTDRIAALFRRAGAHHTLINLGEFRANGPREDGTPWRVGLRNPSSVWKLDGRVEMTQGALATSAGSGHLLGERHHLFEPRSGTSPVHYSSVSVVAPSAALADGLSTALYVLPIEAAIALTAKYASSAARFTMADGRVVATDGWCEVGA